MAHNTANNTDRQAYWDNYINYWQKRVADSNAPSNNADKMPDDRIMASYITWLVDVISDKKHGAKQGQRISILDYGCGFGRAYPYFENLDCAYSGCDIASSCIAYMSEHYPSAQCKKLLKHDVIPFSDECFDGVFCYGVFDACFQHITLEQILRVLNIGGIALITGKNNNYFPTDELALNAEIGARKNKHPNFFTDTRLMIEQLQARHVKILQSRFFLHRADNATDSFVHEMPEQFYTYALLIQRTKQSILTPFCNFSHTHSKTFLNHVPK